MYKLTITSKTTGTAYTESFTPEDLGWREENWGKLDMFEKDAHIDRYIDKVLKSLSGYKIGHNYVYVTFSLDNEHQEEYSMPFASYSHLDEEQDYEAHQTAFMLLSSKLLVEVVEI
jgi:hypothetical protein